MDGDGSSTNARVRPYDHPFTWYHHYSRPYSLALSASRPWSVPFPQNAAIASGRCHSHFIITCSHQCIFTHLGINQKCPTCGSGVTVEEVFPNFPCTNPTKSYLRCSGESDQGAASAARGQRRQSQSPSYSNIMFCLIIRVEKPDR